MSRLVRTDEIDYAPGIAASSPVRAIRALLSDHVLFRPYSPYGTTASGLWLERDSRHPRIWGWLLAVPRALRAAHPGLEPGAMLIVKRHHGEPVASEVPDRPRYLGHKLDVLALPAAAVQLAIHPPLVAINAA